MVHTDKIVKDLELLHEGVFDLKELLNIIKEFFKRHDYTKKVIDGRLKFVINAEIQRDYDQKWKTNPLRKIARAVYDRYVIEEKQDRVSKELKSIIDNLKKEIVMKFRLGMAICENH